MYVIIAVLTLNNIIMQNKLLLLLLVGLITLPRAYTQVLTEIRDTTTTREMYEADQYIGLGLTARVELGYRGMRDFYEEQGFNYFGLQEYATAGVGFRIKERFHLNLAYDHLLDSNEAEDVEYSNGTILSLNERKQAVHVLAGYRVWQKRHESLIVHAGFSWLRNRVQIVERFPNDFDFNTANLNNPRGVRSWPMFIHQQGALHIALQLKIRYRRAIWWSADQELKLGFVSGLRAKSWRVEPGTAVDAPSDVGQYLYISGVYHFFSRQRQ